MNQKGTVTRRSHGVLTGQGQLTTCKAIRCGLSIAWNQLMCGRHWKMVPADIQERVYAGWRAVRNAGGTKLWREATRDAIAAVAIREHQTIPVDKLDNEQRSSL